MTWKPWGNDPAESSRREQAAGQRRADKAREFVAAMEARWPYATGLDLISQQYRPFVGTTTTTAASGADITWANLQAAYVQLGAYSPGAPFRLPGGIDMPTAVKIPVSLEPTDELLIGYKVFSLDMNTLMGGYSQRWESATMEAQCSPDQSPGSHPNYDPKEKLIRDALEHLTAGACRCGIYAAKTIEQAEEWKRGEMRVLAEVVLFGRWIEHDKGWRAQFARIEQLWLPKPTEEWEHRAFAVTANALIAAYGTPVSIGWPEPPPELRANRLFGLPVAIVPVVE